MHRTRPLGELRRADEPRFGGKSTGLGELIGSGIPVPPGYAIATSAFDAFVEQAHLAAAIHERLEKLDADDLHAVRAASEAIRGLMTSAPVPDDLREEIGERYAALGGESEPVAVRSSAVGEDSHVATFAGQQETYLWVRGAEAVCDAVRDCWASLYSPEAVSYRARMGEGDHPPAMGVTIQLMVDAEISGVMFTCNPVSGDPSTVAVNASWGLGLAVVGGEVTPDYYLVSKVTRELLKRDIERKHVEYRPDPAGRGTVELDVAEELQRQACLGEPEIAALMDVASRIEAHFGSHQDIEWALARGESLPERLHVLQSRPVTTVPKREPPAQQPASALSLVMATFGAAGTPGKKP